jgi:3'-phosphoadenosine 5'-phosphosulfate sulfotransferase (PAPS reductase)/FAD synthetase
VKHIIPISGGKDSQAVAIWFKNNIRVLSGDSAVLFFCDTGNEAADTYKFITDFSALMQDVAPLYVAKNKHGETLIQQAERKGRFPSTKRRFCTSELKVEPQIDYILSLEEDCVIYDGRRRQESPQRAGLETSGNYFEDYYENVPGDGLYRKRDVQKWIAKYTATQKRPILKWDIKEVYEYISENGFSRNPLYDLGFNRVGCFPCIMCSLGEILRVAEHEPEKIDQIREVEQRANTTFFGHDKIPTRFCKNQIRNDKGKLVGAPTIDEVIQYAKDRRHDDGIFKGTCLNKYVQCE